jgi:Kef-type K+ transport system membrane component KefB
MPIPDPALVHASPFYEFAALLVLAAAIGFAGQLLRQPLIVGFIAVGVIAGPSVLGIVRSHESIELLAELGIAVLLFLIGLKLDLKLIRTLGGVALATGLGQVLFTSLLGFLIGLGLGLDAVTSLYVAIALTFSSTIIIVKLLSDKREVDSLHGRIAVGFLIVQDLVVVVAMMALSAFGIGAREAEGQDAAGRIGELALHGAIALAAIWLFMRYAASPIMARAVRTPELMVVFAIGWAALLAALGDRLGFSMELGGLLAGIALASTPYREAIVTRLSSLRDFLLLFFFIALGSQLDLDLLGEQAGPALVFSLFVLIGNPLIVLAIMGWMGYRKRTGFLAGLTVAQISEFSLIFMAMGVSLGHVGTGSLGLVTLVGLITIALSVYMITYSHVLYRWLHPLLGVFERRHPYREEAAEQDDDAHGHDVILFGLGRYGGAIAERLTRAGSRLLAVDFNPEAVRDWRQRGIDAIYGDACDQEFIESLPLQRARWVVSAMPQHDLGVTHEDPRLVLLDALARLRYPGRIAVGTHRPEEAQALADLGADLVLLPFQDAADRVLERLHAGTHGAQPERSPRDTVEPAG